MAGVSGHESIDELVAKADSATVAATPAVQASADLLQEADDYFRSSDARVPVSIVAQQSSSSPLVDVSILIHAGAGHDPDGKKRLASLTAAMVTDGGSVTHSIQEINAAMYPIASGFNAQVDKEMTRLSGQVHKDNLDSRYGLVRNQLLRPGWREQDFERVTTQLMNAVRTGLVGNNDEELGKEVLYSNIYGDDHPYGSPNLGRSGDIGRLTIDDVRKFYSDYYTINNITIGLSGGYPDSFAEKLSDDLAGIAAGRARDTGGAACASARRRQGRDSREGNAGSGRVVRFSRRSQAWRPRLGSAMARKVLFWRTSE
jgi:zinc protease